MGFIYDMTEMQRWNIIEDVFNDILNKGIDCYVDIYRDKDEDDIVVFGDNESVEIFNQHIIKYLENHDVDISEEKEEAEDSDDYFISLLTGYYDGHIYYDRWTYSDEGFLCDECGKWYKYADYYRNYMLGDGFIICEDCVKENEEYKEMYIDSLLNNYEHINTLFDYSELLNEGFEAVNKDVPFENGMYGDNDNPQRIMEKAMSEFPEYDYIFSVVKIYNPFTTQFNLYRREKDV